MKNIFKKFWEWIVIAFNAIYELLIEHRLIIPLIIGIIVIILLEKNPKGCKDTPQTDYTLVYRDTTIKSLFSKEVKHDTVILWYEKIVYKQVKPDVIYYDRIDSVYIEKVKYLDFMLRVEKEKTKLNIYAVNLKDSVLKRLEYSNVGPEFTATSQNGGIFVKSKKIWWNGLESNVKFQMLNVKSLKEFDKSVIIGFSTDWNFGNSFRLGTEINYDTRLKEFLPGLYAKIKIIQ